MAMESRSIGFTQKTQKIVAINRVKICNKSIGTGEIGRAHV